MISAIFHAVFSRFVLPIVLYVVITVITVISTINRGALGVGISVLAASALSYLGSAAFTGSLLERKTKRYRTIDLIGIGALATLPIAAAFVLAYWSDFQIGIFDYNIDGFYWVLLGIIIPIIVVRPKDIFYQGGRLREGSGDDQRTGPDRLNSFSAPISGASAGVRLPCGRATCEVGLIGSRAVQA